MTFFPIANLSESRSYCPHLLSVLTSPDGSLIKLLIIPWNRRLFDTVMLMKSWASQRLKSPSSPVFIQFNIKHNIKAAHHLCTFVRGIRRWPMDSLQRASSVKSSSMWWYLNGFAYSLWWFNKMGCVRIINGVMCTLLTMYKFTCHNQDVSHG